MKFFTHSGFWGTQVVYSPKYDISFSVNYSKGWLGSYNAPLIQKVFSLIENKPKP
jgi:D-alanyl-D-alanine carboxypeptidase